MADATFRGSREQLRKRLASLPSILLGKVPDPGRTVRALFTQLGMKALSLIQEAYLIKAAGGTDAAGITWKPLSPKTIAYGRRDPTLDRRRRYAAKAGRSKRPLLTVDQDRLWRQVYAQELNRLTQQDRDHPNPTGSAAARAWAAVKRVGGKTVLETYGTKKVDIGRDTGRLLASLTPNRHHADCVFEAEAGKVSVGTQVAYAKHFHRVRPIWPEDPSQWPAAWKEALAKTLEEGLKEVLRKTLERGR